MLKKHPDPPWKRRKAPPAREESIAYNKDFFKCIPELGQMYEKQVLNQANERAIMTTTHLLIAAHGWFKFRSHTFFPAVCRHCGEALFVSMYWITDFSQHYCLRCDGYCSGIPEWGVSFCRKQSCFAECYLERYATCTKGARACAHKHMEKYEAEFAAMKQMSHIKK